MMAFKELKDTLEILFFVDADEKRWGEIFFGFEIKPPKAISENKDMLVLVAVKYVEKSLLENIKALGATNIKMYYPGLGIDDMQTDKRERYKPGILVEASLYAKFNKPTGAERLMFNIMQGLDSLENDVLPVTAIDGKIVTSGSCAEQCEIYRDSLKDKSLARINIVKGDKILFLSCTVYGSFHNIVEDIENNIASYVLIWDIYYTYKCHNMYGYYKKGQVEKLKRALANAKGIICYSKTVADEVIKYYKDENIRREDSLNVYIFPLGFDINVRGNKQNVRASIKDFMSVGNVFLMVGTIRTHKGYRTVLDAFEKGRYTSDTKLLILGQEYSNKFDLPLLNEIRRTSDEKDNVLWISDATDDEVGYCYKYANALIQASLYEGYGLPIVEAAQYGLPLICSDIPIFREVSCGKADFFKVGDADDLLKVLNRWISEDEHPDSREIPLHTWKESAEALMKILEGKTKPYMVIG